jgi:hypothetical protein
VKEGFSLGTMIYFLTEEHYFVPLFEGNLSWGKRKQFEQSVNLLRKYHDQIVPYLDDNEIWESNYWKHKNQLLATQQIYNKALIAYYRKNVTTQGKGVTKSGKKGASVNARRKAARAFTSFFRAVER